MRNTWTIKKSAKHVLAGFVVGMVATFGVTNGLPMDNTSQAASMGSLYGDDAEQDISIEYISKKLENIGELSTVEMFYDCLYTMEEGSVPFITKKGFSMSYTATVKAGIDTSLMKIGILDDEVHITIPESELQSVVVDPDSIKFYDEKRALFNWSEKTDVTKAVSEAKKDVTKKADEDQLLLRATNEATYVIRGLLEGSVGDKKVIVIRESPG